MEEEWGVRLLKLSAEFGAWGEGEGRLSMDLDSLSWSGQRNRPLLDLTPERVWLAKEMEGTRKLIWLQQQDKAIPIKRCGGVGEIQGEQGAVIGNRIGITGLRPGACQGV